MKTIGERILDFNKKMQNDLSAPDGIELLNPFANPEAVHLSEKFYNKFYGDDNQRVFLFGINPGRHGAGVTGISFTDPIRLENVCRIANNLDKRPELSSEFIYEMIEAYGGAEAFFFKFYISSVCPVGFVKDGKNVNYYDSKELQNSVEDYIIKTMDKQVALGAINKAAICIGEGANYKYFNKLNDKYGWFQIVHALPHPRFIMQYRRKRKVEFIEKYMEVLKECEGYL